MTKLFKHFFESSKAAGFLLLLATIGSLIFANSSFSEPYIAFWNYKLGSHSISGWINDGLMAVFFLLIGLELEREVYTGELATIKKAAFPFFAAFGGMLVPVLVFFVFNYNTVYQNGAGIPMATDIAFAVTVLSVLGNKIPLSLKVFLTSLAVIDDLGAILVIAFFYTKNISLLYLGGAFLIMIILFIFNRKKIHAFLPYAIGGIGMWFCFLHSGVHATISGVLLAFVIPFGQGDFHSLSYKLQERLHKPVSFLILPLFAMANTAIVFNANTGFGFNNTLVLGIFFGLFLGKPLGVFMFARLGVYLKLCELPKSTSWKHIFGIGVLAGIGFTMSLFITLLAFLPHQTAMINEAKIAIFLASFFSGVCGLLWLRLGFKI
jgi:Na+:H+ antiporter, NhaA family